MILTLSPVVAATGSPGNLGKLRLMGLKQSNGSRSRTCSRCRTSNLGFVLRSRLDPEAYVPENVLAGEKQGLDDILLEKEDFESQGTGTQASVTLHLLQSKKPLQGSVPKKKKTFWSPHLKFHSSKCLSDFSYLCVTHAPIAQVRAHPP